MVLMSVPFLTIPFPELTLHFSCGKDNVSAKEIVLGQDTPLSLEFLIN